MQYQNKENTFNDDSSTVVAYIKYFFRQYHHNIRVLLHDYLGQNNS